MKNKDETLLRLAAQKRTPGQRLEWRYDAVRQVTQVRDGDEWVDSWDASVLAATKKMDVETGEDQKGA